MSQIGRRQILQWAGSIPGAIALHQFSSLNRYAHVLAQNTSRKLALLVGINQYVGDIPTLQGCLTDVEMQRELLMHRFRFNPQDILVVSDDASLKPTRNNILNAFEAHLIQQAKPGDVVLFHFSGHGSLVADPNPVPGLLKDGRGVSGTMVPCDRASTNAEKVQDITGRSLFLLMSALQTENVTALLDSCHAGGGLRGNLVVRSIPARLGGDVLAEVDSIEIEYQQRWLATLKLSAQTLLEMRQKGVAKGVAIGSAHYNQLAADVPFDGFYAGAFTYLLTHYLWQQTSDQGMGRVFINLARRTKDVANTYGVFQEPVYLMNSERDRNRPVYFLKSGSFAGEGVVQQLNLHKQQVQFWLGGMAARSLAACQAGAVFSLIDGMGREVGLAHLERRKGLTGYGQLRADNPRLLKPGMVVRDRVRALPNDLKLRIGVHSSFGKQSAIAQKALEEIEYLEVVPIGNHLDFLLGRMAEQSSQTQPPLGKIGVFTASLLPVEGTFGEVGESIAEAVDRLRPRFVSLLAGQILQAIGGEGNADVRVNVSVLAKAGTPIASDQLRFKPGTELRIQVRNAEKQPLYMAMLTISSSGTLQVRYPYLNDLGKGAIVPVGEELIVPGEGDQPFRTIGPAGFFEVLVLASRFPLQNALNALLQIGRNRGVASRSPITLRGEEPLTVANALLVDSDRSIRGSYKTLPSAVRGVDVTQLVVISTTIEVTD